MRPLFRPERPTTCPLCGELFTDGLSLRRHIIRHQLAPEAYQYEESRVYKCTYCMWRLQPSGFEAHAAIHFSEVFFRHREEFAVKRQYTELTEDPGAPSEVKHFLCCRCRKPFKTAETLNRHYEERHQRVGTVLLAID